MKKTFRLGWFMTNSGIKFNLMDPKVEMINFADISHSLALINRFNGHTVRPYSVAEHLCHCCEQAEFENQPKRAQLEVLIHDFSEAYYQDLMSPIKLMLGATYKAAEDKCQGLIQKFFTGYNATWYTGVVKIIDLRMLATEARDITIQERWWHEEQAYAHIKISTQMRHWTVWRDRLKEHLRRLT